MLEGTVCIVAGGGNGLGEVTAHELAAHGAHVVVNDLGTSVRGTESDATVPERVAADIREVGGEATAHHGDVSDFDDAQRLIEETATEHGRIDFVVNFAGILRDELSYKLSPEDWRAVIETNLTGQFAPLRAACAHWREESENGFDRQRSYLAVSGGAARGAVGQANYASAKAGVLGLVRSVSTEMHRWDVQVNALVPNGYTRMTETVPEEHRPYTREEMPPERVAPLVAYLASDAATGLTGCTLYAGGNRVGLLSDPEINTIGVNPDGWTLDSLIEHFESDVAADAELTRTNSYL